VKLIKDFLGLLYDLVIGDCWQIAAGAAVLLGLGIELLRISAIPTPFFAVLLGVTLMSGSALIILFEARLSYRKNGNERGPGKPENL
jgi:hypothetical protein